MSHIAGSLQAIQRIGVEFVADPSKCDVYVVGTIATSPHSTAEFVPLTLAMMIGARIVTPDWVVHSIDHGNLMPVESYLHPDTTVENAVASHASARERGGLFDGKTVYIAPQITPEWKPAIEAIVIVGGGKVVTNASRLKKDDDKVTILVLAIKSLLGKKANKFSNKTFASDFLVRTFKGELGGSVSLLLGICALAQRMRLTVRVWCLMQLTLSGAVSSLRKSFLSPKSSKIGGSATAFANEATSSGIQAPFTQRRPSPIDVRARSVKVSAISLLRYFELTSYHSLANNKLQGPKWQPAYQ